MNRPALEAYWLLIYTAAGCGLGLFYGFLRPLRRRRSWPADLLFMAAAGTVWAYLGFGLCGGDLRIGCLAGLFLGIWLFDRWPGRLLRPIFSCFWKGIGGFFSLMGRPMIKILKKIGKFTKNLFATVKKWSTIRWNYPVHFLKRKGGSHDGKAGKHSQPHPHRSPKKQQADRSGGDLQLRAVPGGRSGAGNRDPKL